jgi:uncharacterized membrane protein YccC
MKLDVDSQGAILQSMCYFHNVKKEEDKRIESLETALSRQEELAKHIENLTERVETIQQSYNRIKEENARLRSYHSPQPKKSSAAPGAPRKNYSKRTPQDDDFHFFIEKVNFEDDETDYQIVHKKKK